MAEILVRGLDKRTVDELKRRAKRNGRSLQSEARLILQSAAGRRSKEELLEELRKFRESLGRTFDDSTELIREDRER